MSVPIDPWDLVDPNEGDEIALAAAEDKEAAKFGWKRGGSMRDEDWQIPLRHTWSCALVTHGGSCTCGADRQEEISD